MLELLREVSPLVLGASACGIFVLWFIAASILNQRKLRRFPGPPAAAYSRFWLFWQSIHANVAVAQQAAIKKYGCPARIAPNLLVIDDPEMIRHFNSQSSGWRRSQWYQAMRFDPRLDTVFSTRDEKIHAELRSREVTAYNGRDVATLEADIDLRIRDLINLVRIKYTNVTVDMASLARYFTLDVLSTVAFGRPFGFMAANEDLWRYNEAANDFFGILELISNHSFFFWLLNLPIMQMLFGPKPTDKHGMGPALAFAREAVAERFGPNPKVVKKDMLGHFVEKGLSQVRCESEAFLQIIAGSDSTTTVLRCTMYLLAGNPVAYGRLREEIDRAFEDGTLVGSDSGAGDIVSYASAQKLPYLSAVLWEGIRMFPPLFGLKSKIAPPGGDTVKDVYFPAGTEVCICDASMCRREDIFGEDAGVFRPERWLEADGPVRKRMQGTVDAIFGTGRFQCLGKHIAMMELHKTSIELIRNFDWQIANPMSGVLQISHGVHNQSGMNMVARPRTCEHHGMNGHAGPPHEH